MPKQRQLPDVIRLRRRLAHEIAESLERQFSLQRTEWDTDVAARIVESMLPLSVEEAAAEWEAMKDDDAPQRESELPGLAERLRAALGYGPEVSLLGCIKGAVERMEAIAKANQAASEHDQELTVDPDDYPLF